MRKSSIVLVLITAMLLTTLFAGGAIATKGSKGPIQGRWEGTYTSVAELPDGSHPQYNLIWWIRDNGDGTLDCDTKMTSNVGTPEEFSIWLFDQPGTYDSGTGAFTLNTDLLMHVTRPSLGHPVATEMQMSTLNTGVADFSVNPPIINCGNDDVSGSKRFLTYLIFSHFLIDEGASELTKVSDESSPTDAKGALADDDPLVGNWLGDAHSNTNTNGLYTAGLDIASVDRVAGTIVYENVYLSEACPDGHNMKAEFPTVTGTISGNQVTAPMNIIFDTILGEQTMAIAMTGTITENPYTITGTYDIDSILMGLLIDVDDGVWIVTQAIRTLDITIFLQGYVADGRDGTITVDLYDSEDVQVARFSNVTLDGSGHTVVDLTSARVPAGDYRIVVRHYNHIDIATANLIDISAATTYVDLSDPNVVAGGWGSLIRDGGKYAMRGGDASNDEVINIFDWLILGQQWNRRGRNLEADFNGDGVVNIEDFLILGGGWGFAVDPAVPAT